jgi:acyl-CoA dehydrogenase
MALTVIDRAIQSFGAEGVSQDTELASKWAGLRTLRIADVCTVTIYLPDSLTFLHRAQMPSVFFPIFTIHPLTVLLQVHIQQVGQRELRRAPLLTRKAAERKKKEQELLEKAGFKSYL